MLGFSGNRMFKQLEKNNKVCINKILSVYSLYIHKHPPKKKKIWGIYPLQHTQLMYFLTSASIQTYLIEFSSIYTRDLMVQMLDYLFTL